MPRARGRKKSGVRVEKRAEAFFFLEFFGSFCFKTKRTTSEMKTYSKSSERLNPTGISVSAYPITKNESDPTAKNLTFEITRR